MKSTCSSCGVELIDDSQKCPICDATTTTVPMLAEDKKPESLTDIPTVVSDEINTAPATEETDKAKSAAPAFMPFNHPPPTDGQENKNSYRFLPADKKNSAAGANDNRTMMGYAAIQRATPPLLGNRREKTEEVTAQTLGKKSPSASTEKDWETTFSEIDLLQKEEATKPINPELQSEKLAEAKIEKKPLSSLFKKREPTNSESTENKSALPLKKITRPQGVPVAEKIDENKDKQPASPTNLVDTAESVPTDVYPSPAMEGMDKPSKQPEGLQAAATTVDVPSPAVPTPVAVPKSPGPPPAPTFVDQPADLPPLPSVASIGQDSASPLGHFKRDRTISIPSSEVEMLEADEEESPAPRLPTPTALHRIWSRTSAAAAMQKLEPMPVDGSPGFISGLPYYFKVVGARFKRQQVIRSFRREISAEKRKEEDLLRRLGERAYRTEIDATSVQPYKGDLRKLEADRALAEKEIASLVIKRQQEEEKYATSEHGCYGQIKQIQQAISEIQPVLREKKRDMRAAERLDSSDEKPDSLGAKIQSLEDSIGELEQQIYQQRVKLQTAYRELSGAKQALSMAKGGIALEERRKELEITRLNNEIARKFIEIGRIVETERLEQNLFSELFNKIDTIRRSVVGRDEIIARLQKERDSYNRQSLRNGKIIIYSLGGALTVGILTLIIIFGFLR